MKIKYVSQSEMQRETGSPLPLGYSQPDKDQVLIRKGLSNKLAKEVKAHEFEHMAKGEEGPFLGALLGGVAAGLLGSRGSSKAASTQAGAADRATQAELEQYYQTREDLMPWLRTGEGGLNQLAALYGITPTEDGYQLGKPDYSAFYQSPDYQFALQEGEKGINRLAAATGRLGSGSHFKDMARFNQGLASQNFGNYTNRLASMAGVGQTAGTNLGSFGANAVGSANNAMMQGANARASGIMGKYNTLGNIAGGIGNYFSGYNQLNNDVDNLVNYSGLF